MSGLKSFVQIFRENKKIIIPRVQRSYAQGREEHEDIRTNFVQSLLLSLTDKNSHLSLDFVYGKSAKDEFVPLDGQQRLTTLFLLHWYAAVVEDKAEQFVEIFSLGKNHSESKFCYKTRKTATEFCHFLISKIKSIKLYSEEKTSENLKNLWEFRYSWELDPTVNGMLTMLDKINSEWANHSSKLVNVFDRLVAKYEKAEEAPIYFYFMDIDELLKTDGISTAEVSFLRENELYITMNSRGLPLTPFENFKAEIYKFMEDVLPDEASFFDFPWKSREEKESFLTEFRLKMDTDWSNLFWPYRTKCDDSGKNINNYDNEILFFFRSFFTNYYAFDVDDNKDEGLAYLRNREKMITFARLKRESIIPDCNLMSPTEFSQIVCKYAKMFGDIKTVLDFLYCHRNEFPGKTSYFNPHSIWDCVIKYRVEKNQDILTYQIQLQWYAYCRFIVVYGNHAALKEWMRVIRNLTENTSFDHVTDYCRALRSIEKDLLPYAADIVGYLATNNDAQCSGFLREQFREEKLKASLRRRDDRNWNELIEKSELHPYLSGQIGFLLKAANITDEIVKSIDLNNEYVMFEKVWVRFNLLFGANGIRDSINVKTFIRGLLALGVQSTTQRGYKFARGANYCFLNNGSDRDTSWKRLLRYYSGVDIIQKKEHEISQTLLTSLLFSHDFPDTTDKIEFFLDSIIESYSPEISEESLTVRGVASGLVLFPEMLEFMKNHEYQHRNPDKYYLLSKKQIDSWHNEYHSWIFALTVLKQRGYRFQCHSSYDLNVEPWIEVEEEQHSSFISYQGAGIYIAAESLDGLNAKNFTWAELLNRYPEKQCE